MIFGGGECELTNWGDIRTEWEQSDISFKELADKYGLKDTTIRSRKNREDWQRNDATQRKNVATNKSNEPTNKEPTISIDSEGLTDKQMLFVSYYLKYWNATKAYQKAYECDYASAMANATRMIRNDRVAEEIQKARDEIFAESYLSSKAIIQKYMDIAFADIGDYLEFGSKDEQLFDDEGNALIDPKTGDAMTYRRNYVAFNSSADVDGTIISEVKQGKDGVSIKLSDRMKALEKLEKYIGLMSEEEQLKVNKLNIEIKQMSGETDEDAHAQGSGYAEALNAQASEVFDDEGQDDEEV